MAASPQKDVIYVDPTDEITGIIEKVQSSSGKVIALVLPKRATVFQSIVNMKLLKRSVGGVAKNLVLITSEPSILPLAGAVGLHVAKTLQSKPVIPEAPSQASDEPVSVESSEVSEEPEKSLDKTASIGSLAGLPPEDDEENIDIDNDEPEPEIAKTSKKSFNKKLKVPDFNQFRTRILLGGGALAVLIVFWVFATFVWPHATITIKTNNTEVTSTISATVLPTLKEADLDKKQLPGILKESKKTDSQKVTATGKLDKGEKAKGTTTFSAKTTCSPGFSVPAGTTITAGSFSFVTQAAASLSPVDVEDGKCVFASAAVAVLASKAGDSYNLSARDYSVAGFSSVTAKGSAMSGGTTNVVSVVSQEDIDGAKQKIIDAATPTASQDIAKQLNDEGYFALKDTFVAKDPLVVSTPNVGAEAADVTVNVTVSFTMVGAKQDDLTKLLEEEIKKNIDESTQKILSNGLDTAAIRIDVRKPTGETTFTLEAKAQAGVEQNESDIKKAVFGQEKNEVRTTLSERPGVVDVDVNYSPFWVHKVPSKEGKITIIFEQEGSASTDGQ